MDITLHDTGLRDCHLIQNQTFEDQRGFFQEVFRLDVFEQHGLPARFVQLNHSGSVRGTVRGLHFQWDPPMAKLMRVVRGEAFLVAVDIRTGSPTLGRWFGTTVAAESRKQLFAPAGFARGFCVLSDYAEIEYLCTGVYNPAGESGVLWSDPAIGIEWPVDDPVLSAKDEKAQTLEQWLARPESDSFRYA
jgi:dTDP-4-dehydrorhamnose 3,5-epimerase